MLKHEILLRCLRRSRDCMRLRRWQLRWRTTTTTVPDWIIESLGNLWYVGTSRWTRPHLARRGRWRCDDGRHRRRVAFRIHAPLLLRRASVSLRTGIPVTVVLNLLSRRRSMVCLRLAVHRPVNGGVMASWEMRLRCMWRMWCYTSMLLVRRKSLRIRRRWRKVILLLAVATLFAIAMLHAGMSEVALIRFRLFMAAMIAI